MNHAYLPLAGAVALTATSVQHVHAVLPIICRLESKPALAPVHDRVRISSWGMRTTCRTHRAMISDKPARKLDAFAGRPFHPSARDAGTSTMVP
jgi:hypothetical protein